MNRHKEYPTIRKASLLDYIRLTIVFAGIVGIAIVALEKIDLINKAVILIFLFHVAIVNFRTDYEKRQEGMESLNVLGSIRTLVVLIGLIGMGTVINEDLDFIEGGVVVFCILFLTMMLFKFDFEERR